MILYYITDRRQAGGNVLPLIEQAVEAGVDWIQIREKDLPTSELYALTRLAVECAAETDTRILVNGRADVAIAAGAVGVHLPSDSFPPTQLRPAAPDGFRIGVSCHALDEVRRAEQEGADFVVLGPVFDTPSKHSHGPPLGLEPLSRACEAVGIPVLALGGITVTNAADCLRTGAAGIAAISLFQNSSSMLRTVQALRRAGESAVPQ
jgi:thiamine-phosphate pyrophosphorylase